MDNQYTVDIFSNQRTSGTSSSFNCNLKLPSDGIKYNRFAVSFVEIPKTNYSVKPNQNYFYLIENGTPRTITIPIGTYGLNSWRTVLQAQMNSGAPLGWTYTVTYPNTSQAANTGLMTYSVTGNLTQPSIQVFDFLYRKLGFNADTTTAFVGGSLTSPNYIFLNATQTILISSNMADGMTSVICKVNASTVPDGGMIIKDVQYPQAFAMVLKSDTITNAQFTLSDQQDGKSIDLNGLDWSLSITFWRSKEEEELTLFAKIRETLDKFQSFLKLLVSRK